MGDIEKSVSAYLLLGGGVVHPQAGVLAAQKPGSAHGGCAFHAATVNVVEAVGSEWDCPWRRDRLNRSLAVVSFGPGNELINDGPDRWGWRASTASHEATSG
jgi:hypothetical protein